MKKIIVGISAADGVQIGVRLLKLLREIPDVETHLVMSRNADTNLRLELGMDRAAAETLADVCYPPEDLAAAISSGSFYTDGMIVAPCSMKTLSAIANGYSDSLLIRAADVCIKECRKVVLMPARNAAQPDPPAQYEPCGGGRVRHRSANADLL